VRAPRRQRARDRIQQAIDVWRDDLGGEPFLADGRQIEA
jgi:hypothetical protein